MIIFYVFPMLRYVKEYVLYTYIHIRYTVLFIWSLYQLKKWCNFHWRTHNKFNLFFVYRGKKILEINTSRSIKHDVIKQKTKIIKKGLFNNYVTLSCLYAKFRWLISRVQLSPQPLSVNVIHGFNTHGTEAEVFSNFTVWRHC